MKSCFFRGVVVLIVLLGWRMIGADTNSDAQNVMASEKHTEEKRTKPVLDALQLNDPAKETAVREIVGKQIKAINEWHAQNDAQLKPLWTEAKKTRAAQNETAMNLAYEKIDGVYAGFKPKHDQFRAALLKILTPQQVETVEDALTVNKVKVTFNAYGEIFHGLNEEQKAFILKNLKAAREQAIDAGTMGEKSDFFKKYKIKIEAYLTAQGYDVKQSYKDFVAKQAANDPKKPAAKLPGE